MAGILTARFVRLFVLVLALGVLASALTSAHSALKDSEPADGARVETMPEVVELTFTEPVETALSVFKVYALPAPPGALADRQRLNGLAAELVARVLLRRGDEAERADSGMGSMAGSTNRVTVPLKPDLKPGTYVVMWRVLSVDTHPVQGFLVFTYAP